MIAPPEQVTDPTYRSIIRKALRTPSGRAVVTALAENVGAPLRAGAIAQTANVSTSAVRKHVYRLMQLGFATQAETTCPSNGRPVAAWRLTSIGYQYAKGQS